MSATQPAPASTEDQSRAPSQAKRRAQSSRQLQLEELGRAFRRTFRNLNRLRGRDTHLGGDELSHAQYELLVELYDHGELPAGELATLARLTPASVTQMLEHLADSGHVERVRSDSDRRVVVSRLTPKGESKIELKRAAWESRWRAVTDGLEVQELRAATRVLERLAEMFEEAAPGSVCETSAARPPAGERRGRNPV